MKFGFYSFQRVWSMAVLLAFTFTPGFCQSAPSQAMVAAMEPDSRTLIVQSPGLVDCKSTFSATIISGGKTQVLSSVLGTVAGNPEHTTEETPYGKANITTVTVRFEAEQVDLLFRLGQLPGVPGVLAQAGIRNVGQSPVKLVSVKPLVMEAHVAGNPTDWLVTILNRAMKNAPPAITFGGTNLPIRVHENGGFYRTDGAGFFFGPVGEPISYVEAAIARADNNGLSFVYSADMSGVMVDAGLARWGQQVALLAEPPRQAIPRWVAWVAQTHGARTAKGALSGWNSWAFHGMSITGEDLLAEVDAVLESQERLRPEVMQLDGGSLGQIYEPNTAFPEEPAFYAQRIASTGARPGVILTFRGDGPCFSNAAEKIKSFVSYGFTYLKISRAGLELKGSDPVLKTAFETMREGFSMLREVAGEETYLLYNGSRPDRATIGRVDANLTGDAQRQRIMPSIIDSLRSLHLNGKWFAMDSGCYFMGTDLPNVSEIAGGWPIVRTRMSVVGLSCGAAYTGDPWHLDSFRPYWRNVEVMSPPAKERTEVLDMCLDTEWPRLVGHVKRDWGDMAVALLWNPGTKERNITLDFATAGLDPTHRYAVWSFWDNRYLGVVKGSWTTPALAESACQHLRFTDLEHVQGRPVLIGSDLHIYCGAAEVKQVKSSRASMEIELTDAGAREGNLFVYSRQPVVLKSASGCTVTGVAQSGENAWRISLADRKRGVQQRLVLNVILPVTQQIWFWVLIGVVLLSLLFGAWRYVAWLHIQRENSLERERARIARDLHDEIGANLSRISLIGSMLAEDLKDTSARGELLELTDAARTTHRAFDEIVWSVNPRNDTVRSLLHYICRYADDFFAGTPVSCRSQLPENLPDQEIPPDQRHHIFLAVKEALHNILKYAEATQVDIVIRIAGHVLIVEVTDNGKGFNPDRVAEKGNGLRNMQERMRMAGGNVSLTSQPGAGTRVCFEIPLKL
jgi:two-component sensor histidine kinase